MPFITPMKSGKYVWQTALLILRKIIIWLTSLSKYPFEANGIKEAVAVSKDLKKIQERHLITPLMQKR